MIYALWARWHDISLNAASGRVTARAHRPHFMHMYEPASLCVHAHRAYEIRTIHGKAMVLGPLRSPRARPAGRQRAAISKHACAPVGARLFMSMRAHAGACVCQTVPAILYACVLVRYCCSVYCSPRIVPAKTFGKCGTVAATAETGEATVHASEMCTYFREGFWVLLVCVSASGDGEHMCVVATDPMHFLFW